MYLMYDFYYDLNDICYHLSVILSHFFKLNKTNVLLKTLGGLLLFFKEFLSKAEYFLNILYRIKIIIKM
jgi:hypothetical protein